jgi:hypothetical protein
VRIERPGAFNHYIHTGKKKKGLLFFHAFCPEAFLIMFSMEIKYYFRLRRDMRPGVRMSLPLPGAWNSTGIAKS